MVTTFCLSGAAIWKAGRNFNNVLSGAAMIGSDHIIDSWINQAESMINVATRFNWTDAYAELNNDVKSILTEAASCLAAIYIIEYDMSGYTSRGEAESMINILRDRALHGINILRDIKARDFANAA